MATPARTSLPDKGCHPDQRAEEHRPGADDGRDRTLGEEAPRDTDAKRLDLVEFMLGTGARIGFDLGELVPVLMCAYQVNLERILGVETLSDALLDGAVRVARSVHALLDVCPDRLGQEGVHRGCAGDLSEIFSRSQSGDLLSRPCRRSPGTTSHPRVRTYSATAC